MIGIEKIAIVMRNLLSSYVIFEKYYQPTDVLIYSSAEYDDTAIWSNL